MSSQNAVQSPDGRVLEAGVVRLVPLVADDADALFAALDDERVWASGYGGGPAGRPADVDAMRRRILAQLALVGHRAYAVRTTQASGAGPAGTLVGTSALGDVDVANERVHLGWTAYAPSAWASAVNPSAKLALLTHAFEDCGMRRVKIQTDLINARSQAAIAKLGAVREGVLREHMVRADGSRRDTVVFSILASQWPDVRGRLERRIAG